MAKLFLVPGPGLATCFVSAPTAPPIPRAAVFVSTAFLILFDSDFVILFLGFFFSLLQRNDRTATASKALPKSADAWRRILPAR